MIYCGLGWGAYYKSESDVGKVVLGSDKQL